MPSDIPARYTVQLITMEEPWVADAVRALAAEYARSLSAVLRDLIRTSLPAVRTDYERERLAQERYADRVRASAPVELPPGA